MEAIDRAAFDRALERIDPAALGRAGTLEALMIALGGSLPKREFEPDSYVVKLHQPDIRILEDFPNAKILFAARHPIANYEAIKRDTSRVFAESPWNAYHTSGIHGRGVVRYAAGQVRASGDWLRQHPGGSRIRIVQLEVLQVAPEQVMEDVAAFLEIAPSETLVRPTTLGSPSDSNLSSGAMSGGAIVQQETSRDTLTGGEYAWARRQLASYCADLGYEESPFAAWNRFLSLVRPMTGKLPPPSAL